MAGSDAAWVPESCALPTVEQPSRMGEFDSLLVTGLVSQTRVAPNVLRWSLDLEVEAVARDLAARESECCSFFRFSFAMDADGLVVEVQVPPAHVEVLDALAARAAALAQRTDVGSVRSRPRVSSAPGTSR